MTVPNVAPGERRLAMTRYESRDGRLRLFRGDSHRLHPITSGSVGVILTSPPYWVRGRGRPSAERYAHDLAVGFGREWKRVLAPDGDLWLVIGDRHDGAEWVGMDALVIGWLRHRLASSVARVLGPNTLPGALGQPREPSPALPEGGSGRATARNHSMLDAATASLPPGQHLGRDPGARGPG